MECVRLEGTTGDLVQLSCLSRVFRARYSLCPNGFWIFPEKKTPWALWVALPVFCHPHSKELFSHVQVELSMYLFLPIASCAIIWHRQEEPGCILLVPSLQILIDIDKVPSPGYTGLASSAFPHKQVFQFPNLHSSTGLSPVFLCLSWPGKLWTRHSTPGEASTGLSRGSG